MPNEVRERIAEILAIRFDGSSEMYQATILKILSVIGEEIEVMRREEGKHDGHNNDDRLWCYDCNCSVPEEEFTNNWLYNQALTDLRARLEK